MSKKVRAKQLLSDNEVFHNNNDNRKSRKISQQPYANALEDTNFSKIPSRLCYIFMYASMGSYKPYMNIFLVSLGLSVMQAGVISALRIFAACLCIPCWKLICSYQIKRSKVLFWTICVMAMLLTFPMPWIARSTENLSLKFAKLNKNCSTSMIRKTVSGVSVVTDCHKNTTHKEILFMVMLTFNLANGVFSLPIPSYIDKIVTNVIDPNDIQDIMLLPQQKIFGTIGHGVAVLLAGIGVERYQSYTAVFFVYLPFMILLLISSFYLFKQVQSLPNINSNAKIFRELSQVMKVMKNFSNLFFMFTILIVGTANGLNNGFLFIYLQDLKASNIIIGSSMAIANIAELAVFPFRKIIIKATNGPLTAICACVFCYFIQYLSLSFIQDPWLVLPIQVLHGLTYGMFWSATIEQIQSISRRKIVPTLLGLVQMLHFNIGYIVANLIGGILYERLHSASLFRKAAYLYLVQSILVLIQVFVIFFTNWKNNRRDSDIELQAIGEVDIQ